MTSGILGVGVAFPRLRLASAELKAAWGAAPKDVDERCIPAFDEDPFTLAVEAAGRALAAAATPAASLATIARTYGGAPGRYPALGPALGAASAREVALEPAHGADLLGPLPSLPGPTLAVAAAVPDAAPGAPEEASQGAGAVAFVLGADGAALPRPAAAPWRRRAGDLGVAAAWLDTVAALVEAKAPVQGLDVERALGGGRPIPYVRALQERRVLAGVAPLPEEPMGAYVPPGTFAASTPARWRLEGARCGACAKAFLPAPARCLECGGPVEAHAFARRGRVHAATVIGRGGAPSEFAEQQRAVGDYGVVIVELEGGARTVGQVTDADAKLLAIGADVEPVLRRLYRQQGEVRYGLKWRPR